MNLRTPAAVACVVVVAGCLADRSVPNDVGSRTPCATNADCPSDNVCPKVAAGERATCVPRNEKACGNGVLDKGEQCDDGNLVDGDGCRHDCTVERCGDGIVDTGVGEVCDDGNTKSGDGCSADCKKLERCGDAVVDVGEDCDLGALNADTGACTSACKNARCGDGLTQAGVEACDDGNTTSGDGCSGDCHKIERCGDGVVDVGEACDDGVANGGTVEGACYADCTKRVVCGDDALDPGEACDDGNTASGDGCRGDCRKIETCGDAIVDANEECDDGNANDNDGCDSSCHKTSWSVSVVTGLGVGAGDPLAIDFPDPLVAVDRLGRVFVADGSAKIYRIDPPVPPSTNARAIVVAGTGTLGFSGDGGPATGAQIAAPRGFSVDNAGRLFIADCGNSRVRRVDADGTMTTIAGSGTLGFSGDGGPAIAAQLSCPFDAVVDSKGQVFIADINNCAIRKVDAAGVITTIRGGDCTAQGAVPQFRDLEVDAQDRVLVAEGGGHPAERFDGTTFTPLTGAPGSGLLVDGGVALQMNFRNIHGIAVHGDTIYVAVTDPARIVEIDAQGIAHFVAGTGAIGFGGDGGPALQAELDVPSRVAVDAEGNVYESEIGNKDVRRIDAATSTITSIAGAPPHVEVELGGAVSVAVDAAGRTVWADATAFVARVEADGAFTILAGDGTNIDHGDGLPATQAGISGSPSIAIDANGRVIIGEGFGGRIRAIETDGTMSTVAGLGTLSFSPDGTPALTASVFPTAVAVDAQGRIVFYDANDEGLRRIEADGTLHTLAGGTFTEGFVDDVPADQAVFGDRFVGVIALAAAQNGDVFIADGDNARVRKFDAAANTVTTVVGDGTAVFTAAEEGGPATAAGIGGNAAIAIDGQGRLLVGSGDLLGRVFRVDVDGTIHTIFGNGTKGDDGDGGPASLGHTSGATSIAPIAGDDFVFVSVFSTVRRVQAGIVTTQFGLHPPAGAGPLVSGALASPSSIAAIDSDTLLVATSAVGVVERVRLDASSPSGGTTDVAAGYFTGFPIGADPLPVDVGGGALESRAAFADVFANACGIAWDDAASFAYVADRGHGVVVRVRVPTATRDDVTTWTEAIVAGATNDRRHVDGTDPSTTRLVGPCGLALDPTGATLFVGDTDDDTVRVVDLTTGASSTLFGVSGAPGNLDDLLSGPTAVALDPAGDAVFVADTDNHRVRRIDLGTHAVVDVIGTGEAASSGDGTPARVLPVQSPRGLAFDPFGDLVVTSTRTVRLVTANDAGVVDGSGAVVTLYGAVPRDRFPEDSTFCLSGIDIEAADRIRIVDACQGYLLELQRTP